MTGDYRVQAAVTLTVWPGLVHAREGNTNPSVVSFTVPAAAASQEGLEIIVGELMRYMADEITNALTVHPRRPSEHEQQLVDQQLFWHRLNLQADRDHPATMTPDERGLHADPIADCPACRDWWTDNTPGETP